MDRRWSGVAAFLLFAVCAMPGCGGTSTVAVGVNQNPPTITAQPMSQTVAVGQTATFSVTATGDAPLSYKWQENGATISGATSSSYTTQPTTAGDNGDTFSVTVSNPAGSRTSNTATLTLTGIVASGTDVTTYKNDLARTGQNLTETLLTTSNVNSTSFGLRHTLSVMGKVDAQPLYLSQLTVGGAPHNVVFVATEHDLVYAFDSDTGAMLWNVSLAPAGESVGDDHGCGQVSPEAGITATPVIDRNAGAHGTIFVVAMTKDSGGLYHERIHALDVASGAELLGGPVEVQATYPTSTGTTTFDPHQYKERPGLLLLNGSVYTMWSSHCDISPYTAWIIVYSETTLARTLVFNLAPNSNGNGPSIWMSGGAPAVDSAGNIYVLAANGVFETTLDPNGFPVGKDYGNAFVKMSTANNTLAVADYFEEDNEVSENGTDADLGSGSAMLLPDLKDSNGVTRHLAVGAGKDSNIYVLDRDNMGKFSPTSNNIWQELDGVLPGGIWSTPAYFSNTVYYGDVSGTLKAFTITSARLSSSAAAQSTTHFEYPGTAPAISANGSANGIVWAAENSSPAVLHAFSAGNLVELYNSAQAGARDQCGSGNKFITPTIADGKVFLGTQNSVCVFGLLP
jgi:Immunoglobulin domain